MPSSSQNSPQLGDSSVTMEAGERPRSPGGELGLVALFQFGAFVAASVAVVPFLTKAGKVGGGLGPILTSFPASWLVLVLGVVVVCRSVGRPWRSAVRLDTVRPVDLVGLGIGVVLQFVVGLAYLAVRVDEKSVSRPAKDLTDRAGSIGVGYLVLAVFVVVGAPIVEELFYRGVLLNAMRRLADEVTNMSSRTTTVLAVVASSAWFGAIHFQPLQLPALVVVGLVCAAARLLTGRLATSIAIHMGFNLVTMVSLGIDLSRK
jgi:uncharacterized protein